MFARFHRTGRTLHVSLCEAVRDGASIRQVHVAALGSVPLAMTAAERIHFWTGVHQRLGRLGNRTSGADRERILGAIDAWAQMPTSEEQATGTVTLSRVEYDALLAELEDAQERAAMLGHALAKAKKSVPEPLITDEAIDAPVP